ncbi:hypothetical protein PtB15_16B253 [Puccinia triticina]|nr:hypothetical protein PtB15_16B253 [Puccinia triticina]
MFSRLIAIAYFAGLFSLGFLDRPPRKTWEKRRVHFTLKLLSPVRQALWFMGGSSPEPFNDYYYNGPLNGAKKPPKGSKRKGGPRMHL